MINFFSKYKIIFYLINLSLIVLCSFPGSLLGCFIYDDCRIQPQITSNFLISSNHLYAFGFVTIIGLLTYLNSSKLNLTLIYLVFLSIFLEMIHLLIPNRSFQWSDLFGNLVGVIIVILIYVIIKNYGIIKK